MAHTPRTTPVLNRYHFAGVFRVLLRSFSQWVQWLPWYAMTVFDVVPIGLAYICAYSSGIFGILLPPYLMFLAELPEGVLKLNEITPGIVADLKADAAPSVEDFSLSSVPAPPSLSSVLSFLGNGLELIWNIRGVGWKFGRVANIHVAKDWRDLSDRSTFLRQTLHSIVWTFLVLDVTNSILAHSDLRRPGGTMHGRGSNIVESLLISTFHTLLTIIYTMNGEDVFTLSTPLFNLN